ncbi:hypothetical protein [Streptomyces cyaneus]|uniref:hypothetical protein n=1 Tax=Streptomyces cyaneus TaxID=1904 RepID=UPI000FF87797|nr:hypothetical protein [Streptomyces cyaneus]
MDPRRRRHDLLVRPAGAREQRGHEATLRLPAVWADSVREGRTPPARVDGVRFVGMRTAAAAYRLPSGSYRLTSRLR